MTTSAIEPATACAAIIAGRSSGRPPSYHLSKAQTIAIAAAAPGARIDDELIRIANAGDDRDRRIAMLEGALTHVETHLGEWLTDNTEEDFGEEPEIDGIRGMIDEVLNPAAHAR